MIWSCHCKKQTLYGDPPGTIVDLDGFHHARDSCETTDERINDLEAMVTFERAAVRLFQAANSELERLGDAMAAAADFRRIAIGDLASAVDAWRKFRAKK